MPPIFHFTDIANLSGIFGTRALRCHALAPTALDVGNQSIKAYRRRRPVGCGPGGVVGDYVPFYYAPRSPMLYSITRGNVDGVSPDQRRLAYLVSSTEAVESAGLPWVLSDGNAATMITTFSSDRGDLQARIDWPLMTERIWRNTEEDPDRVRRRMAEFLVHEALALELITAVAVISAEVRDVVSSLAATHGCEPRVLIRPTWYF